jgi:hypothetical protein
MNEIFQAVGWMYVTVEYVLRDVRSFRLIRVQSKRLLPFLHKDVRTVQRVLMASGGWRLNEIEACVGRVLSVTRNILISQNLMPFSNFVLLNYDLVVNFKKLIKF